MLGSWVPATIWIYRSRRSSGTLPFDGAAVRRVLPLVLSSCRTLDFACRYLFTAFSVFTVLSVEWGEGGAPSRVVLRAARDNSEEPEDLPLAPWY